MKKLVMLAALVALVSGVAYAGEADVAGYKVDYGTPVVGVRAGHNFQSVQNPVGITAGSKFGKVGAELSFDRATAGPVNVNQWGLIGSYDLYTYKNVTLAAKGGAAYVDPSVGNTGWFGIAGLGLSYPVTKNVLLVTDYSYQNGSVAVNNYNGSVWSAGMKYSF